MLMFVLHLHPDTEVFDESPKNRAFLDFRVRGLDVVKSLVQNSKFSFACFKPVVESHRASEFLARFPEGRFVWIYRDYRDVAGSSLNRFPGSPSEAIRTALGAGVATHPSLREGLSETSRQVLQEIFSPELTEFDCECLVWWARNRIFIEQALSSRENVLLMRYEDVVTDPGTFVPLLFRFAGMRECERAVRHVHGSAVGRHAHRDIAPRVKDLCEELAAGLHKLKADG